LAQCFPHENHYSNESYPGKTVIVLPSLVGFLALRYATFLLVGLEFELKAFALAKQVLSCLNHTSSPFCSDYFGDGVL
jgi:hypothetical protein